MSDREDAKQPREPAGSPKGGQFAGKEVTALPLTDKTFAVGMRGSPAYEKSWNKHLKALALPKGTSFGSPEHTAALAAARAKEQEALRGGAAPETSGAPMPLDKFKATKAEYVDKLSEAEKTALVHYSYGDYVDVNNKLRAGRAPPADVPVIDAAIAKAPPLERDTLLYRSVTVGGGFLGGHKVGERFVDKAYGSTSVNPNNPFTESLDGRLANTRMVITAPRGLRAAPIPSAMARDEQELLLPRNTKYEVTKIIETVDPTGHYGNPKTTYEIHAKIIADEKETKGDAAHEQPRVPAGSSHGGQFASKGGGVAGEAPKLKKKYPFKLAEIGDKPGHWTGADQGGGHVIQKLVGGKWVDASVGHSEVSASGQAAFATKKSTLKGGIDLYRVVEEATGKEITPGKASELGKTYANRLMNNYKSIAWHKENNALKKTLHAPDAETGLLTPAKPKAEPPPTPFAASEASALFTKAHEAASTYGAGSPEHSAAVKAYVTAKAVKTPEAVAKEASDKVIGALVTKTEEAAAQHGIGSPAHLAAVENLTLGALAANAAKMHDLHGLGSPQHAAAVEAYKAHLAGKDAADFDKAHAAHLKEAEEPPTMSQLKAQIAANAGSTGKGPASGPPPFEDDFASLKYLAEKPAPAHWSPEKVAAKVAANALAKKVLAEHAAAKTPAELNAAADALNEVATAAACAGSLWGPSYAKLAAKMRAEASPKAPPPPHVVVPAASSRPIHSIVGSDMTLPAFKAKRADFDGKIAPHERSAILEYTSSGYIGINSALRKDSAHDPYGHVAALDAALAKAAAPHDVVVYRGVGSGSFLAGLKAGDDFVEKGYSSSSVDPKKAFPGVKMVITIPKGYPAAPIPSYHSNERELLIRRNTRYSITKIVGNTYHATIVYDQ